MSHVTLTRRRLLAGVAGSAGLALAPSVVGAVEPQGRYPQRPITLIVPYPAGGSGDYIGRTVADKLAQRWNQPVVVQNRPGAGGTIGVAAVSRSAPDGYTIVLTTASVTLTLAQQDKPSLDLFTDIEPVSLVAVAPMVLVAHKDFPAQSVKDLIALTRQAPGRYFYGGTGQGGVGNLAIELVKLKLGLDLTYVPYQGGAASIAAVVANQIPLAINDVGNILPFVKAGTLKPLLVASPERFSLLPDAVGLSELGVSDLDIKASLGLAAPKGTPAAITAALAREVGEIMKLPDVQARFYQAGLQPVGSTPQAYAEFLKAENRQFRQGVQATGLSQGA
ncbi:tripartite tricarboxylate transporter substrate binding protein [Comamonadaceae bacterium PP-2]